MLVAVLDACVLIPGALADTLLRCAECDLYRPAWSAQILDEVRRNLPAVDESAVARRLSAMRKSFPDAEVTGFAHLIEDMANHPKDRHVLAVGVAIEADFVVTANLRDFPPSATDPYGIEALHPDDFLCDLLDRSPATVVRVITEQAASTGRGGRPQLTVSDVLQGLRGSRVVRFAERIDDELRST